MGFTRARENSAGSLDPHCNSPSSSSCGNCTIAFTSAHGRLLGNSADWDETTRRLTFRTLQAKGTYVLSSDGYEFRVLGVGIRAVRFSFMHLLSFFTFFL